MRKFLITAVFALLMGLSALPLHAQNSLLRYADKQFELENFSHAAALYEQAHDRKPTHANAQKAALSYQNIQEYEKSFEWWKTTIAYEEASREDFLNYLLAAMKAENGMTSQELLVGSPFKESAFPEINFDKIRELNDKKANVKLVQPKGINSDGSDFRITEDKEGNKYFTSDRGSVFLSEKPAVRLDAKSKVFSEEKSDLNDREYFGIYRYSNSDDLNKMTFDVPGGLVYSDPSLMESKNLLFYTTFRNIRKVNKTREFEVHPEIFFSTISANGTLSDNKAFPINDATKYGVMHPFIDEKEKKIYFSSDMPGGLGGFDLYYVTYDNDLNFGNPVNLGSSVNTVDDESHPFIMGEKFFFSSKGHDGLGGMDIFQASYANGSFGNIENMGVPFNSPRDDFGYFITSKGKRYLSSDRKGGMGLDDIYLIEDLNKYLLARVTDCNGNVISEEFETTLTIKNQNENLPTRRGTKSELLGDLLPETDYTLTISKKGYFRINDHDISTKGLQGDTLRKEYRLAPIPYNMPVFVDIVYYDLDKSQIRANAQPTLDKIADLMNKYSFIDLKVGSHTDARASKEYNEALSERRANAVREYLAKYNIPESRVKLDWFGEEKRTNDCGDGVSCPETEHQLNRRSELVLEAFPDKNIDYDLPAELMGKDICDPAALFSALNHDVPTIYFDFDKATLRPVHKTELERLALLLQRMQGMNLQIEGHTDQRGNEEYNLKLSERRAKAVMDYLVKRGVELDRMSSEWLGKTKPVHDCGTVPCTESMHQMNRRTELQLK
ncbi:OmpA family protein [Aquiflexum sp. LQ15W]|uniref:OmpA family protein n=1 Tax=Cognataquiflexum nitidum TaxID=2922272 RepID=UPI001F12F8EE|nr:OmpA family protein [Cognataquiflexum nitidum]MCH6200487.1 OmpA family protein [Cognataquiflexum nitidum]